MPKKKKNESLYYKIEGELKEEIQQLRLKEGDRIMSEAEICKAYGVSRITAKKALNNLEEEGYIKRIPGKGSFVNFHILEMHSSKCYSYTEEIICQGKSASSTTVDGKVIMAGDSIYFQDMVRSTFWDRTTKVYYIKRIRYVDGKASAISESFIPLYLFTEEEREKMKSYSYSRINYMIYTKLKSRQMTSNRAVEETTAVCLEKKDAKLLGINAETPLIRTARTTYTDESVLEYLIFYNMNIVNRYTLQFANVDKPLKQAY